MPRLAEFCTEEQRNPVEIIGPVRILVRMKLRSVEGQRTSLDQCHILPTGSVMRGRENAKGAIQFLEATKPAHGNSIVVVIVRTIDMDQMFALHGSRKGQQTGPRCFTDAQGLFGPMDSAGIKAFEFSEGRHVLHHGLIAETRAPDRKVVARSIGFDCEMQKEPNHSIVGRMCRPVGMQIEALHRVKIGAHLGVIKKWWNRHHLNVGRCKPGEHRVSYIRVGGPGTRWQHQRDSYPWSHSLHYEPIILVENIVSGQSHRLPLLACAQV